LQTRTPIPANPNLMHVVAVCSFMCQVTSARRQRSDFYVPRVKHHLYYQSNHSKVVVIPLSALPKDTTSEIYIISLMLNVMQGRCEYRIFSILQTRRGNRPKVFRPRGKGSNLPLHQRASIKDLFIQ